LREGPRRIIGIDPGLAASGWGLLEADGQRLSYLAHGCIKTLAAQPHGERLLLIFTAFRELLERYAPDAAAMETLYFARNVTSAMAVAEARGVFSLALAERSLPLREFTPQQIKMAVIGRGVAEKSQVQEMVRIILGLPSIPTPNHAADALAAAICSAHPPVGCSGR
jgi:crossover junction endodeoxyribonuclease RuvC